MRLTYDIIITDECGDECTYSTGYTTEREARDAAAMLMENHPEWYGAQVEPNRRQAYQQAWYDRSDNDTLDLY
jgi:hypothetical protein